MLFVNWTPVAVVLPSAAPPPLPFTRRTRLREVDCSRPPPPGCCRLDGNGMYDQRVLRGSNFVRARAPAPVPVTSAAVQRRFREARLRLQRKIKLAAGDTGRVHAAVQCARGPSETHNRSQATQADASTRTVLSPGYYTKPPSREVAVKCKTGLDASTQVTYGDLLDFEVEVAPLARELADVFMQQAVGAVLYEDGAAALRRQQAVYVAKRRAEQVELDRLNRDEAVRRRCGLHALAVAERAAPGPTFRVIHARAMAEHHMAGVLTDALDQLQAAGYLMVDNQMDAWMQQRFIGHRLCHGHTNVLLDEIIGKVVKNRSQTFRQLQKRNPRFKDAPPEVILPDVTFSDVILPEEVTSERLADDEDNDDDV